VGGIVAERLVLALVPDLMFATQIEQVLEHLGYAPAFVRDAAALLARAREEPPALVLLDLAARGVDVPAVIQELKADPATGTLPIVAFGPHLDAAAVAAARAAGADTVVANSKLAFDLPGLLARYASG
jgi:CheY-like chemotaxis protein